MNDYYLKTTDEATLWQLLIEQGLAEEFTDDDNETRRMPKGINLDIIGQIYKLNPEVRITDPLGYQFHQMDPVDGFHANIRGSLTEEQQAALPLIPAPATPYRVWA